VVALKGGLALVEEHPLDLQAVAFGVAGSVGGPTVDGVAVLLFVGGEADVGDAELGSALPCFRKSFGKIQARNGCKSPLRESTRRYRRDVHECRVVSSENSHSDFLARSRLELSQKPRYPRFFCRVDTTTRTRTLLARDQIGCPLRG
jgi:hypothetical protein